MGVNVIIVILYIMMATAIFMALLSIHSVIFDVKYCDIDEIAVSALKFEAITLFYSVCFFLVPWLGMGVYSFLEDMKKE